MSGGHPEAGHAPGARPNVPSAQVFNNKQPLLLASFAHPHHLLIPVIPPGSHLVFGPSVWGHDWGPCAGNNRQLNGMPFVRGDGAAGKAAIYEWEREVRGNCHMLGAPPARVPRAERACRFAAAVRVPLRLWVAGR